jgi:hypothetical protein
MCILREQIYVLRQQLCVVVLFECSVGGSNPNVCIGLAVK